MTHDPGQSRPSEATDEDDALDEALEESFPASDPPARSDPDVRVGKPNGRRRDESNRKD